MQTQNFNFALLDPRNKPESVEANQKILGSDQEQNEVLGIEVTVPALAERCNLGNLDPQHSQGENRAAVEAALDVELPPKGSTLVTIRPDLDSVAAMAVLDIRASGGLNLSPEFAGDMIERIADIAQRDRFEHGGWQGPQEIPSKENPWPQYDNEATPGIATLASAISDFKVPIEERVETMKDYLVSGALPKQYQEKVSREREAMIDALDKGEIDVKVKDLRDIQVAVVHSEHRSGTSIGYMKAPVVVAVNDNFSFRGGPEHRKLTICQFDNNYVDMDTVKQCLNEKEPGVGGSKTILGSKQGEHSELSIEDVLDALETGREAYLEQAKS